MGCKVSIEIHPMPVQENTETVHNEDTAPDAMTDQSDFEYIRRKDT